MRHALDRSIKQSFRTQEVAPQQGNILRLAATLGPASGIAMVMTAAKLKRGFSWKRDTLSSLMNADRKELGYMFQAGTVESGLATLLLANVLRKDHRGCPVALVGEGALLTAAIGLVGTGITNGPREKQHGKFATTFFVSGPLALVIEGIDMMMHGSGVWGAATAGAGLAAGSVAIAGLDGHRLPARAEAVHAALVGVGGIMAGTARFIPISRCMH